MNTPTGCGVFYEECGGTVYHYFDEEEMVIPTPTARGMFYDDMDRQVRPPSLGSVLSFLPADEVVIDLTTQSTCVSTPPEVIVISDDEDERIDTSPNTPMEVSEEGQEEEEEEDISPQGAEMLAPLEIEDDVFIELSPEDSYVFYDSDSNEELSINTGFTDSAYFSGGVSVYSSSSNSSSLSRAILNGLNYSPYGSPEFPGVVDEEDPGVVNEGSQHQGAGSRRQEDELDQWPELPEGALEFLDAVEVKDQLEWPELPAGMLDVVDFIEKTYIVSVSKSSIQDTIFN